MPRGVYEHRGRKRMLTEEQEAWIAERYPHETNAKLVRQMADEFGVTMTTTQIAAWARRHRDATGMDLHKTKETMLKTRRDVAESRRIYTDEMIEFMRSFIPGHVYPEFADEFEKRFGWRPTRKQYRNSCVKYQIRSGVKGYGCFVKGGEPSNKGKKWDDFMSPEAQQRVRDAGNLYHKGQRPPNAYHKILDMRQDAKDGRWYIYVAPRNAKNSPSRWISYARFVWMQHHGREFPENCKCLHCNHDNQDDRPENLMAVPNDIYAVITQKVGLEYWDRESLKLAIAHAKMVMTAKRLDKERPRRCEVCGKVFRVDESRMVWGERVRVCKECADQGKRAPMRQREAKE